jgi:exodeoxyribonuclease VII large subunit
MSPSFSADLEPTGDGPVAGILTVSEMTSLVKETLEEALPMCWVTGEMVDFSRAASGHCYLTLKDRNSQLPCVLFRFYAREMTFTPEPGMMVVAYGNISVYERGGRYQFLLYRLQPAGVGELALAFERLRSRLEEEGLFEAERKRALPAFPRAIGIVTSETGAAVRDIVEVVTRRAPGIQLVLRSARVQGQGAAGEISRAIDDLNRLGGLDILIVGRGGGSAEDLWAFNEEVVARAIYASEVPVVSAVGHEIDYTIADYVADVRAPTPSAAAEIVAPDRAVLAQGVQDRRRHLQVAMDNRLRHLGDQLGQVGIRRMAEALRDRLDQSSQDIDEGRRSLAAGLDGQLRTRAAALRTEALRLQGLSPLTGLARGFAFCEHEADGRPVHSGGDLRRGQRLRLRFGRGGALCRVEDVIRE